MEDTLTSDDNSSNQSTLNLTNQQDSLSNQCPIQRANDIIVAERERPDSADVPENYFGNADYSHRRYAANRSDSYEIETLNINDDDSDLHALDNSQPELFSVEDGTDVEISTASVLSRGLGLALREDDANNQYSSSPTHNWQSSKHRVKSRLLYLLNTSVLSDVTFLVGGSSLLMSVSSSSVHLPERIVAHKFVLSMSSAVFDAMFNGHMAVTDDSAIEIPDVEPSAFRALLKFLYTDEIIVESETVMSILYAAKKYAVPALEHECVEYLKENICCDNVFMLLTQARLFDEPVLAQMCLDAIDKSTTEALASDGFTELDNETLCIVLARDSLGIRESKLFSAVTRWAEHVCVKRNLEVTPQNLRLVLGKAVNLIRYPLMTVEEFAVQVAQSKILDDAELVQIFLYFTINPKPPVSFCDRPRCCLTGKEQVVSRFCQVDHRWGYSGTSDRIKYTSLKYFVLLAYFYISCKSLIIMFRLGFL